MRVFVFALALAAAAVGDSRSAQAESLKDLVRDLKRKGVGSETHKGATTFIIMGGTAAAWEQSLARRLAEHYRADSELVSAQVSCTWRKDTADDDSGWTAATRRAGAIAETLQRHGVPKGDIAVFVKSEPDTPVGGVLTITLTRHRPYYKRVGDNLVDGVTDVVASPAELPRGVVRTGKKQGVAAGGTKGVVKGFGSTLRRAGGGAVRILTFWAG